MKITKKYVITCLLILGSSYCLADNSTQSQKQQPTSVMNLAENGEDELELLDLFPTADSNMHEILNGVSSLNNGTTANNLFVIVHGDGCDTCTYEMNALTYEYNQPDSVILYLQKQHDKGEEIWLNVGTLLGMCETTESGVCDNSKVYCSGQPDHDDHGCKAESDSIFLCDLDKEGSSTCPAPVPYNGLNIKQGTDELKLALFEQDPMPYPTIWYFDEYGVWENVGLSGSCTGVEPTTAPGTCATYIANHDVPNIDRCDAYSNPDQCKLELRNAASNWVCSVATQTPIACNQCADNWWQDQPACYTEAEDTGS